MESLSSIDRKQGAVIGLSALVSLVLSYNLYHRFLKDKGPGRPRSRGRLMRSLMARQQRIVGANKNFTKRNQSQEEIELKMEQDLQSAATGTKVIYFDSNDFMFTEEEVIKGNAGPRESLTKMIVKVPEKEHKRLMEVHSTMSR